MGCGHVEALTLSGPEPGHSTGPYGCFLYVSWGWHCGFHRVDSGRIPGLPCVSRQCSVESYILSSQQNLTLGGQGELTHITPEAPVRAHLCRSYEPEGSRGPGACPRLPCSHRTLALAGPTEPLSHFPSFFCFCRSCPEILTCCKYKRLP